jgi:radial spoke head protein 1
MIETAGWWKYGKKDGKGTFTYVDTGMKLVGEWAEGAYVKGKWVLPNGTFFEGDFAKNLPNGHGRARLAKDDG